MGRRCFGHQYMTKIKALMKEIRFSAKIGQSVAVFNFLKLLPISPKLLKYGKTFRGIKISHYVCQMVG